MKNFIGIGQGNAESALDQAIKGLINPNMILFMTSYEKAEKTAAFIYEKFPDIPSIGTIGTTLAKGVSGADNTIVLGLFEDARISCGLIKNLSTAPVVYINDIEQKVAEVAPGREDTVCIEFCTGYEERLVTTLNACFEKKGIQLAGGTVFGVPDGKEAVVAYNGKLYQDACVYALIKNSTGKVKVFKENIYKKSENAKSHFATKVNVDKKSLIELDGRPAATVYSEELGISRDKIIENVFNNPMGRAVGEQVFISSMKELAPNGELINFKRINENDCIYFLELDDYKASEEEMRSMIRSEMKNVSLILSIDCIYRYLLYQNEGYFDTYVKDMATFGNHIGIVGGGEQFNNQHVNQTMVCAVFE